MKAVVLTGIRQMELRDVADPDIRNDDDVLLKIEKVGVCGSDVHYYEAGRIGSQAVQYPYIIGHECAATVEAVADAVDRVKVGDQVVVDPAVPCHNCDQCRAGRENTCRNLSFLGTPAEGEGCLCEYIVLPQECCFPTGGKLTLDQAVLCEPFAIGVYSVQRAHLPQKSRIAILGSGPIGLSCMAGARAEEAEKIYMTDILDYRVTIAGQNGASWAGNPDKQDIAARIQKAEPAGVDAVFECAGKQETLDQAVAILKPGGKLVLIGAPRFDRVSFVIDKIRRKEIDILNIRRQNRCTQKAVDLVASGRADIDFMVTHTFRLDQVQKAFEMVAAYDDGVIKAMIEF